MSGSGVGPKVVPGAAGHAVHDTVQHGRWRDHLLEDVGLGRERETVVHDLFQKLAWVDQ